MQNAAKKIATWEICIRPSTGPTALNQKSGQITGVRFRSVDLSLSIRMLHYPATLYYVVHMHVSYVVAAINSARVL